MCSRTVGLSLMEVAEAVDAWARLGVGTRPPHAWATPAPAAAAPSTAVGGTA